MALIETMTFAFAWWLGLYLWSRDKRVWPAPTNRRLRYAAWGLIAYALALAGHLLMRLAAADPAIFWLTRLSQPLFFLPALFWLGALVALLPPTSAVRQRLEKRLDGWLWGMAALLYLVGTSTPLLFEASAPGPAYYPLVLTLGVLLLGGFGYLLAVFVPTQRVRSLPLGLVTAASLFFALGFSLLFIPLDWLPRAWVILAIGGDLVTLGLAIALLDALEEGETLRPHMLRSLAMATAVALLFGGQIALVMRIVGASLPLMSLLLTIIATAILGQTFYEPLQALLDRFFFGRWPHLLSKREALRTAARQTARPPLQETLLAMTAPEFAKLTRRALSQMGNLPRLANNPLIHLPLIDGQLTTLERAAALKQLLTARIDHLKPPTANGTGFAPTNEWRFYNALYFPYVVGLRPYRRQPATAVLDPTAQAALAWFRQQVPERTLYNWQKAAAELIARDLRDLMAENGTSLAHET